MGGGGGGGDECFALEEFERLYDSESEEEMARPFKGFRSIVGGTISSRFHFHAGGPKTMRQKCATNHERRVGGFDRVERKS